LRPLSRSAACYPCGTLLLFSLGRVAILPLQFGLFEAGVQVEAAEAR